MKKTLNDPQWWRMYSKLLMLYRQTVPRILAFSSSRWDEEKKNKANLCKNSERLIIA